MAQFTQAIFGHSVLSSAQFYRPSDSIAAEITIPNIEIQINNFIQNGSVVFDFDNNGGDKDNAGSPLAYEIVSGNTGNTFSVGSTNGEISLADKSQLNFSSDQAFNLVLRATSGLIEQTIPVKITVQRTDVIQTMVQSTFIKSSFQDYGQFYDNDLDRLNNRFKH